MVLVRTINPDETLLIKIAHTQQSILNFFRTVRKSHKFDINIFGVDCSWTLKYGEDGTGAPKLNTMEIGTATSYCLIIIFDRLCKLPDVVKNFLEARDMIKVGFGITHHADALKEAYGINVESAVDVRHVIDEEGFSLGYEADLPTILGNQRRKTYDPDLSAQLRRKQVVGLARKVSDYAQVFTELTKRRARESLGIDWELRKDGIITRCAVTFWGKYFNQPFDYGSSLHLRKNYIGLMMETNDLTPIPPEF